MQHNTGSRLPALRLLITAVAVLASFPLSVLAPVSPMLSPHPATAAASFTVNSTVDAVDASPGDGVCATAAGGCTLRAAIQEANTLAGADVITLPAGTYTLSIAGAGEDAAATGDLDIAGDVTLTGAGATTTIVEAGTTGPPNPNGIDRVFNILAGANVQISELTVRNGMVILDRGGGFFNAGSLTLRNATIASSTAVHGGGIYNEISGMLIIINSIINSNNTLDFCGRSCAVKGGGILNLGTMVVSSSTISGNTAYHGGGAISNSGVFSIIDSTLSNNIANGGGGIANDTPGTLVLVNSTISDNRAIPRSGPGNGSGGGISSLGVLTILSSTITGNRAISNAPSLVPAPGGGILGRAFVRSTIVAANIADNGPNCHNIGSATPASLGYNLISDASCNFTAPGDLENTDPELGPLQDNGGPTFTHALPISSPAIDAGDPAGCTDAAGNPLTTDQRGFPRPEDGDLDGEAICDLGAYETTEPVVCILTQEASFADGNMTMSYTLSTLTPVTWQVYLIRGEEATLAASGPLEEIDPPFATGPLTFPAPAMGQVVWFTALVDPSSTVLCWDSDQVDTGTPAAGGAPQALPAIQVPLPNGLLARP